ncbi:DUF6318 family protein [Cellulomonas sp. PhB143]|uniref:DUF6318 family protein n=1 Tax=Cellulomonas sp. PhB143 TaxID=2485186 RepID=UPI000F46E4D9|nr:DUF6318 family protein [Cellulomonas sp. PhB143]ROS79122.1 hypothetical protein EDF32_0004 [Cellulomonas sp. PhB143]
MGLLVAATLATAGLAGCSGAEPSPGGDATSSAPAPEKSASAPAGEPTPTGSATPDGSDKEAEDVDAADAPPKPDRPADMKRTDERGAAAAATYFLELYPYVMATGDTKEWDAMSYDDTCDFCVDASKKAIKLKDRNQHYIGGDVDIQTVDVLDKDTLVKGYPVDLNYAQSAARITDSHGVRVDGSNATKGHIGVDVAYATTMWRVLAVSTADRDG